MENISTRSLDEIAAELKATQARAKALEEEYKRAKAQFAVVGGHLHYNNQRIVQPATYGYITFHSFNVAVEHIPGLIAHLQRLVMTGKFSQN